MAHIYVDRSTSAGYRIKVPRPKSSYHENCIPAAQRAAETQAATRQEIVSDPNGAGASVISTTGRPFTRRDYDECHQVNGDKIWRESCTREKNAITKWEQTCGFMKDFDQHGNVKERPDTPSNLSVYSDDVPNTNNQRIGHWQRKSRVSRSMVTLQHRLSKTNRRKHNKELICYDWFTNCGWVRNTYYKIGGTQILANYDDQSQKKPQPLCTSSIFLIKRKYFCYRVHFMKPPWCTLNMWPLCSETWNT